MYPRFFMLFICCPAIPTNTSENIIPDLFCTSSTVVWIAVTVSSIFITTPLLTPLESALLSPRISILPFSFFLPTIATILVVPMSIAATYCSFLFILPEYYFLLSYSAYYLVPEFKVYQGVFIPAHFGQNLLIES